MIKASFLRRLSAFLIDIIPITVLSFATFYFFSDFGQIFRDYVSHSDHSHEQRKQFLASRNLVRDSALLFWIFYSFIADASAFRGTLGKKVFSIQSSNESGGRLTIDQAFKRNISKLFSALPLYLGFLWCIWSKQKRCWHDSLSGSYVVRSIKNSG